MSFESYPGGPGEEDQLQQEQWADDGGSVELPAQDAADPVTSGEPQPEEPDSNSDII